MCRRTLSVFQLKTSEIITENLDILFGYLQGVAGGPQLETLVKKMKTVYTLHRRIGIDE